MAESLTDDVTSGPAVDNASSDFFNNETSFDYYPNVKVPVYMMAMYSLAYSLVFVVGLVGNLLVVLVVLRNPCMKSVTNYFLVNLAMADILVCLFCVPINLLSNLFAGWAFGPLMCKLFPFLQGVSVSASVNTLMAIAIDRYIAICRPLQNLVTRKTARCAIVVIWAVSAAVMSPWVLYYRLVDFSTPLQTIHVCGQTWPSPEIEKTYFLCVIFLTCYTIPLVIITVCYGLIGCRVLRNRSPGVVKRINVRLRRSRVRALEMLVVVVIMFALSWLPTYAVQVRKYYGGEMEGSAPDFYLVAMVLTPVAQWLGSANSCFNPFIYCFFSCRFRNGFRNIVCVRRKSTLSISRTRWQDLRRRKRDGRIAGGR